MAKIISGIYNDLVGDIEKDLIYATPSLPVDTGTVDGNVTFAVGTASAPSWLSQYWASISSSTGPKFVILNIACSFTSTVTTFPMYIDITGAPAALVQQTVNVVGLRGTGSFVLRAYVLGNTITIPEKNNFGPTGTTLYTVNTSYYAG